MSLVEHSEGLEHLAERMGRERFEERLRKERLLVEHQGHGQHRGVFCLDRHIDFYGLVKLCLKVSGLYARAHRNYLDVQSVEHEITLPRLPKAFDGFRILQLSDLHADFDPEFAAAVKRAIANLEYDLVVVTGDFRTCTFGDHSGATEATLDIISALKAPSYAILGNHDFMAKVPDLENHGMRFLLNESAVIERGGESLHLVGIDDPNHYKTHDFEHAMNGVAADVCKVLLSHSPQTHREAAVLGFDLQLSGHTHGGQICLPGGGVVVHDGTAPRHVLSGFWREGEMIGYTSRGTGASGLPVRLNCPAEVTVHVLRTEDGSRRTED